MNLDSTDVTAGSNHSRTYLVIAASVFPIVVTIICLSNGITTVFPHFYYIPIILVSYWFTRRGILFSVLIGMIYILLILLLTDSPLSELPSGIIRVLVFIGISAVVSYLATLLKNEKTRYHSFFESTGSAVVILDAEGNITLVNRETEYLLGHSRADLIGRKITDFSAEENREGMMDHMGIQGIGPGSTPKKFEHKFLDKNGETKDVLTTVNMIPGTTNSIISLIDITERKRAVDALKESEERYRGLIEGLNEALYRMSLPSGEYEYFSPAVQSVFGYCAEDFMENRLLIRDI